MIFVFGCLSAQQTLFPNDFVSSEGIVNSKERPLRDGLCRDGLWYFAPVEKAGQLSKEKLTAPVIPISVDWEASAIKIPSPGNANNFATDDGRGVNL
jgi:hypothetical protein